MTLPFLDLEPAESSRDGTVLADYKLRSQRSDHITGGKEQEAFGRDRSKAKGSRGESGGQRDFRAIAIKSNVLLQNRRQGKLALSLCPEFRLTVWQERALPAIDAAMAKTTGIGARIDLVLAQVRLGLFSFDNELVSTNITKALEWVLRLDTGPLTRD